MCVFPEGMIVLAVPQSGLKKKRTCQNTVLKFVCIQTSDDFQYMQTYVVYSKYRKTNSFSPIVLLAYYCCVKVYLHDTGSCCVASLIESFWQVVALIGAAILTTYLPAAVFCEAVSRTITPSLITASIFSLIKSGVNKFFCQFFLCSRSLKSN